MPEPDDGIAQKPRRPDAALFQAQEDEKFEFSLLRPMCLFGLDTGRTALIIIQEPREGRSEKVGAVGTFLHERVFLTKIHFFFFCF